MSDEQNQYSILRKNIQIPSCLQDLNHTECCQVCECPAYSMANESENFNESSRLLKLSLLLYKSEMMAFRINVLEIDI